MAPEISWEKPSAVRRCSRNSASIPSLVALSSSCSRVSRRQRVSISSCRWWIASWPELDVSLTDVTQGLTAVNLAGPGAREILAGLTDADVSAEALTYLDGVELTVAGIPCLVLRIGFGEYLAQLQYADGSSITLSGVTKSHLTVDDFHFA